MTSIDLHAVSFAKIQAAAKRIQAVVAKTPVKFSTYLQDRTGLKVALKLENLNVAGSFKIRGATNALLQLSPGDLAHGVIAASAGNHAQGVAHTCRRLGVKATIFMPERTPLVKAEATRSLGADVRLEGRTYDDACAAALKFQEKHNGFFIHPFANEEVINGQGTIGIELIEQISDIGLVLVPIGGGGLISGVACALKSANPSVKIIGVQTASFPAMKASVDAGKLVSVKPMATIADGIAVKQPSATTLALVQKYVDDIILVDEDAIASAVMDLMERDHVLAEASGAVSIAALLKLSEAQTSGIKSKTVVCLISGGNIDVNLLTRITTKALIYSGRLMRLSVKLEDRPGRLAELLNIISVTGANLVEVHHNRTFSTAYLDEAIVDLDLETINKDHQKRVANALTQANLSFSMTGTTI